MLLTLMNDMIESIKPVLFGLELNVMCIHQEGKKVLTESYLPNK